MSELLDVTCFVLTSTILSTGSFIVSDEISVLSISFPFWYLILYVTLFNPFEPACTTLSCVELPPFETSFVIVSNGISTSSVITFFILS